MIAQPLSRRFLIVIADLSMILFLVCASALQKEAVTPARAPLETPVMLSVWSDASGETGLTEWLAQQPPDDSQRLSIEVRYRAGGLAAALARADDLRVSAGAAGTNARVLIAEGPSDTVLAQLVQDNATGAEFAQLR